MKATSHKTFTAIAVVVLLTSITKSQAQRCSGANALARYHAQVGLELPMPPRGLRGGVDNHGDEDDYYLFVPEQDLLNPSESESKLTLQHMRRLQCYCANGATGAGIGTVIIDAQLTCQSCYEDYLSIPPQEFDDDIDETLQVPHYYIPTPAPSSDGGGQRLLLEKEHRDNIAAYDPVRQGFHVMRKDGAIMRKYGNGI